MKKCCECKKLVWPWQHSNLAGGVIHAECHQKLLNDAARDPKMREMMRQELCRFERETNIRSNMTIP